MCHRYINHSFSYFAAIKKRMFSKTGISILKMLSVNVVKGANMIFQNDDTIAAIASGLSNSGISVIRISGSEAIATADKIFYTKSGSSLMNADTHTVHYGMIMDGEEFVDEVLLLVLRAPRTYTREDVIEIDCHGGVLVTQRVLETILKQGVRLAEPGEFTKRAFLNGRIDLSQAEGVMDLIDASNRLAMKHSAGQVRGSLKNKITNLRTTILDDVAFIEAALDDPEHIDIDEYRETLESHIAEVTQSISELIAGFHNGKLIREGVNTVILGKPNAGKSTLLNLFAGEERAIVTEIAGTTRDLLEVPVMVDGIQLNITDTAGLRDTDDVVERIGVERAKASAEYADLILYLFDAGKDASEEEVSFVRQLDQERLILLVNKSDLEQTEKCLDAALLKKMFDTEVIEISAKNNIGTDALKDAIRKKCFFGENPDSESLFISNERHKEALKEAVAYMENAGGSCEAGMPEDFISIDLMGAYQALGKILGETLDEDLVNNIFEKFCLGK